MKVPPDIHFYQVPYVRLKLQNQIWNIIICTNAKNSRIFFVYACARTMLQSLLTDMNKIWNKRENEAAIDQPNEGERSFTNTQSEENIQRDQKRKIRTKEPRGSSLEKPSYDATPSITRKSHHPSGGLRKCPQKGGIPAKQTAQHVRDYLNSNRTSSKSHCNLDKICANSLLFLR